MSLDPNPLNLLSKSVVSVLLQEAPKANEASQPVKLPEIRMKEA